MEVLYGYHSLGLFHPAYGEMVVRVSVALRSGRAVPFRLIGGLRVRVVAYAATFFFPTS